MSPAQCAVAGVEEQVAHVAPADQWQVAWRGGAQAAPELRMAKVRGTGKQLLRAPRQQPAAGFVELTTVAAELGGAGNAQAVLGRAVVILGGVAAEHQLVFIVGQRHFVGARNIDHWRRQRIALGWIDGQRQAQRRSQSRAEAAGGQHIAVGAQLHIAARRIGRLDMGDLVAGARQARDVVAHQEAYAARLAQPGQRQRELACVTGLVLGGVGGAG